MKLATDNFHGFAKAVQRVVLCNSNFRDDLLLASLPHKSVRYLTGKITISANVAAKICSQTRWILWDVFCGMHS